MTIASALAHARGRDLTEGPARRRRVLARLAAAALAVAAIGASDIATQADPAQAAGCTYSSVSSTKVYNNNCTLGAYAYRSGTTWYQAGSWVSAGKWSYNWTATCYQYPGMLGIV